MVEGEGAAKARRLLLLRKYEAASQLPPTPLPPSTSEQQTDRRGSCYNSFVPRSPRPPWTYEILLRVRKRPELFGKRSNFLIFFVFFFFCVGTSPAL